MKNLPYILAGLLLVVWLALFLSPIAPSYIHMLLVGASVLILIPPLLAGTKGRTDIKQADSIDHQS